MEFHELLENEKFKAAIGPEKLAIYLGEGGEGLFDEEYSDALDDDENVVLSIYVGFEHDDYWMEVHHWNGVYIACQPLNCENYCTSTLEEHIKKFLAVGDSLEWRPENTELKSDKLGLEELKALGLIFLSVESTTAEDGWVALPGTGQLFSSHITINGKTYERHNGELVEVSS
jgi:hypothetical protein